MGAREIHSLPRNLLESSGPGLGEAGYHVSLDLSNFELETARARIGLYVLSILVWSDDQIGATGVGGCSRVFASKIRSHNRVEIEPVSAHGNIDSFACTAPHSHGHKIRIKIFDADSPS